MQTFSKEQASEWMSHKWKSRIKTPGQVKRNASINRGFSIDSTDTVVDESFTDTMTLIALVTGTFGLTMKVLI